MKGKQTLFSIHIIYSTPVSANSVSSYLCPRPLPDVHGYILCLIAFQKGLLQFMFMKGTSNKRKPQCSLATEIWRPAPCEDLLVLRDFT